MRQFLTVWDYIFWVASYSVAILLLVACLWHKHQRRFPVFVSYVAFCVLKTTALFTLSMTASYAAYFYTYWAGSCLRILFMLGVAFEISGAIFRPLETIPVGKIQRLLWMITGGLFLCIFVASAHPVQASSPLTQIFRNLDRSGTFIVVTIMWLVIFYSDAIGIPKSQKIYGLCAGGLFYLMTSAALTSIEFMYPLHSLPIWRHFDMGTFTATELIWLWYFRNPPPNVQPVNVEELKKLHQLLSRITFS